MFFKLLLCLLVAFPLLAADTTLIPAGAARKYKDNGSNQGTAQRATTFNYTAWTSGLAELGDCDNAAVVSCSSNSSAKYITTYFRRSFPVTNPAQFTTLTLNRVRDDGAAVYLNGNEAWRINMPAGAIDSSTPEFHNAIWLP